MFACTDQHGQPAALKRFRDPYYANTFEREVAALHALGACPGTPACLDHGRDANGKLCIVTTRASGVALDKRLRAEGGLAEASVIQLLRQLLAVLARAHAQGWLHKDVKASNILVDGENFTLLDWGIAELIGNGRAEIIRSKNQDAIAPENYHGRHAIASDFYQLGLLACHALSGRKPYHLDTERGRDYRVAAHCLEKPSLPSVADPRLHDLIAGWLDKNPARRPIGYDLDALLASARPADDLPPTRPFAHLKVEGFLLGAARAGIPYAMYEWGLRLNERQHTEEALFWVEKAADMGYSRAAYQLSCWLEETQPDLALQWLRRAATGGAARACYRLAKRSDTATAMALLRQAAEGGDRRAQYRLARELEHQGGDAREIRSWFELAADRGLEAAAAQLTRQESTFQA